MFIIKKSKVQKMIMQLTKKLFYKYNLFDDEYKIYVINSGHFKDSEKVIPKIEKSIPKLVEIYDSFKKDPINSSSKYECYGLISKSNEFKLNLIIVSQSMGLNLLLELFNQYPFADNYLIAKLKNIMYRQNFRKIFQSDYKEIIAFNRRYDLIFSPYLVYSYDTYVYYEALEILKSEQFIQSIDGIDGTFLFRGDNIFIVVTIDRNRVIIEEIKDLSPGRSVVIRID